MNISNVKNFSPLKNLKSEPQRQICLSKNEETDSFQRSNTTSNVSFKGAAQKIAQEILKSPNLSQKFMGLVAMGAAALIATAQGKQSKETEETLDTLSTDMGLGNIFETLYPQPEEEISKTAKTNSEKEEALKAELEKYKKDNEELKKQIEELKQTSTMQQEKDSKTIVETGKSANSELINIVFPRKRGRLSKEIHELKTTVEGLKLSKENASILNEICHLIINSKSEHLDISDDMVKSFNDTLLTESKKGQKALEEFITNYHKGIKKEQETKAEQTTGSETKQAEPKSNIKIIDKIDLDKIQPKKRARIPVLDPNDDFKNTEINAIDDSNEILNFKIPGTLDSNVKNNLTRLLLRYESFLTEKNGDKQKWMHARPINININNVENDICKEISLRNQGDSAYKNITEADAESIAQLIDQEPRFREFFTLHAALRLIDRFVNFDDVTPLREQASDAITTLLTAIQKGLSNGVEIENYVDHHYNANGARVIINTNPKTNPEAYKLSGSYELILGLCENQPTHGYYNTRNKTPLICTIFANGI